MKINKKFPPNYREIADAFDIKGKNVVFTYGDTLYVPTGLDVSPDLMAHEEVHTKQQGDDPAGWWKLYISDVGFRMEQEVEAYRAQYQYLLQNTNRQYRRYMLNFMAESLAGPIYGNLCSVEEAIQLIKGV